jgi:hypothetical protein
MLLRRFSEADCIQVHRFCHSEATKRVSEEHVRTGNPSTGSDTTFSHDAPKSYDRVDAFVAQVRAELRAEREREIERQRLIDRTYAKPQGDAPQVGPGMEPVE